MKTNYKLAIALVAGAAIGGAAIQGLHAQATPPVYYVSQNEISNPDAYVKEFSTKAAASVKAAGGRLLVAGGKVTPLDGNPPKVRIVLQVWDSLEKLQAWYNSSELKELRKTGAKYAKFNSYAVEGVQQ